jgi:hypothetical protein
MAATLHGDMGYDISHVAWDATLGKWSGDAVKVECDSVGEGVADFHPLCKCGKGYVGEIEWNTETSTYAGKCEKRMCPDNADSHPDCKCKKNFLPHDYALRSSSDIVWDFLEQKWQTECQPVPCPRNAHKTNDGSCVCDAGYHGAISFVGSGYVRTNGNANGILCEKQTCPVGARENLVKVDGRDVRSCECSEGYTGILSWNEISKTWGTCTKKKCPNHATGHPSCFCANGYTGSVHWTGTEYSGGCSRVSTNENEPVWRSVSIGGDEGVFGKPACERVRGGDAKATVANDGSIVSFDFGKEEGQVIRCDISLNSDFSMVKGKYNIVPASGSVVKNTFQVVAWGSAAATAKPNSHYVAAGSLYNVVDPGMEDGTKAGAYATTKIMWLNQAAVTHSSVIRIEFAQAAGTKFQLQDLNFEVYGALGSTVSVTRTVTAPSTPITSSR